MDLALNNLERLICHKAQTSNQPASFMLAMATSRRYAAWMITDTDYTDDIELLANIPTQAESLLHSLEQAAGGLDLHVDSDKTGLCVLIKEATSPHLMEDLWNLFTYLGSNISTTENDINTLLVKAWTSISRLSVIWKSDLSDKIKCSFFQTVVVSILLYGCIT